MQSSHHLVVGGGDADIEVVRGGDRGEGRIEGGDGKSLWQLRLDRQEVEGWRPNQARGKIDDVQAEVCKGLCHGPHDSG